MHLFSKSEFVVTCSCQIAQLLLTGILWESKHIDLRIVGLPECSSQNFHFTKSGIPEGVQQVGKSKHRKIVYEASLMGLYDSCVKLWWKSICPLTYCDTFDDMSIEALIHYLELLWLMTLWQPEVEAGAKKKLSVNICASVSKKKCTSVLIVFV